MTHPKRRRGLTLSFALLLVLTALVGSSALAAETNQASATTTTGQGLEVSVTGETAVEVGDTVLLDAGATLAGEPPTDVNIVYVVDVSGSMENPGVNPFQDLNGDGVIDAQDDCNGDGLNGTAMDAACFGLISLNESMGSSSRVSIGMVAFANGAVTADMQPAAGEQPFTSPPSVDVDGNGTPDVEEVIRSLDTQYTGGSTAGIGLFTNKLSSNFAGGTDYDAALAATNTLLAGADDATNIVFFISDGSPSAGDFTTGAGSPLEAAAAAGTLFHTFGVGASAGPNPCDDTALSTVADAAGGTCTEVSDPSTLSAVLPGISVTSIVEVEVSLAGQVVETLTGNEPGTLGLSGLDITALLEVGDNEVTVTATAADGTQVTTTLTITVTEPVDDPDPDPTDPDPTDPDPTDPDPTDPDPTDPDPTDPDPTDPDPTDPDPTDPDPTDPDPGQTGNGVGTAPPARPVTGTPTYTG